MVLSSSGIEISALRTTEMRHRVFSERVSTGVARLDTMLDGGYLRGTCTLVSGAPGTSKTTLAGAFAEAACERGERALFVSFEEAGDAIARNLASVDIRLGRHQRSGLLRFFSVPASGTTPWAHTLRMGALLDEHAARCLVVDPVTALLQTGASESAVDSLLSLLDVAKRQGVTVLLTASPIEGSDPADENSAIGLSSFADTWIHLSYVAAAGERNRALSIVKSRGTGHSNQVRELILSSAGLTLVDVYTSGGAVLMGALRRQKEEQDRAEQARAARAEQTQRDEIASAIAETQARIAGLRADLEHKRTEGHLLKERSKAGMARGAANLAVLRTMRGADAAPKRAVKRSARRTK
jgi:circadian clock protein KaiC